jgi:2,4-dienoyl-CoA reductase-like NADH-dependent reductase (Old Yellow Enzyme family)
VKLAMKDSRAHVQELITKLREQECTRQPTPFYVSAAESHEDALIEGPSHLADSVHAEGTPVCIQINHAGRRASSSICGTHPVGPSPMCNRVSRLRS